MKPNRDRSSHSEQFSHPEDSHLGKQPHLSPVDQDGAEDPPLAEFLQRYSPVAPAAAPDLEQRIMQSVQTTSQVSVSGAGKRPFGIVLKLPSGQGRWWAGVSSAIAAGFVLAASLSSTLTPAPIDSAELAKLELFLQSNWNGVVEVPEEEELFLSDAAE
jgi:hypothetical protein